MKPPGHRTVSLPAQAFDALRIPIAVLRPDLQILLANKAFLDNPPLPWGLPQLRRALKRVASGAAESEQVDFEQNPSTFCAHIHAIRAGPRRTLLVTIEDVTHRNQAALQAETALHNTEAALLHSREELRALAASLFDTQEDERRRVSRELHDDLSQKMAKLQFDLETLEQQPPPTRDALSRAVLSIRDEVAALAEDLRRLAHRLHPSTLDHLGLSVALRSYVRDFSDREGVRVDFTARKVPRSIPPEVATSLYRVVQEALRNVAKHAGKAATSITLDGSAHHLCLKIRDRGPGFDPATVQPRGGLGLISMQERIRLVRGDFTLQTSPGRGVAITIRVPLGK